MNNTYTVVRKETSIGKIYTTTCTKVQVDNITKYPSSLYELVSIAPVEIEIKETVKVIECKNKKNSVNTVKELNKLIRYTKREIQNNIKDGWANYLIYNAYDQYRNHMHKFNNSNKTCKQIYFNFLGWFRQLEKRVLENR